MTLSALTCRDGFLASRLGGGILGIESGSALGGTVTYNVV
jgi:hypothetical protein